MPAPGDTLVQFGRSYVFFNPDPVLGPGTWVLTGSGPMLNGNSGAGSGSMGTYRGTLSAGSPPVKAGMLVYINSSGDAAVAFASSITTARVVGAALIDANPGDSFTYGRNQRITITKPADCIEGGSMIPNKLYYLSSTKPGFWTQTPDTTTSKFVSIQCGQSIDSNTMEIEIQQPVVV